MTWRYKNYLLIGVPIIAVAIYIVITNFSTMKIEPLCNNSTMLNYSEESQLLTNENSNVYNAPVGIAAIGITNLTTKVWYVNTTSIIGNASIYSLNAVSTFGYNHSGTSLQLNAVLASCVNGVQKAYWLQDVTRLDWYTNKLSFIENVWNMSNPNNNTALSIYFSNQINYTLPLNLLLKINISEVGKNSTVNFYYSVYNKSSLSSFKLLKSIPNMPLNGRIVVAPLLTPSSNLYDAELIFAGPGNRSIDYFSALNATLGLYYLNRSDRFVTFPHYFTKGLDTAETSYVLGLKSVIEDDKAYVNVNMPSVSIGNVIAVNNSKTA